MTIQQTADAPGRLGGLRHGTGETELNVERDEHSTHGRRGAHLRRPTALTIPRYEPTLDATSARPNPQATGLLILALAAALALLLSGGVDTANAEHTPLVLVGNFDQDAGHGDCAG